MSKYNFTYNQRYAVYKGFDGLCQWCKEPVDFRTFHVDHVLPEELLNNTQKYTAILSTYGLDASFNINDYENWIPSHPHCNLGKSDKVYDGLGLIKTILDSCAKNKELEQRIELKLNKEPKKAELLARVQAAIELNFVNLQELQNFVLKTDIMDSDDEDLNIIKDTLNKKLEYQTDKMIRGIMDIVRVQTNEVIESICFRLGQDWYRSRPMFIKKMEGDTKYAIHTELTNRVDYRLNIGIIVNPDIINNHLVIKFREGNDTFDQHTQDVRNGIDWEAYRKVIKKHYLERLAKRV